MKKPRKKRKNAPPQSTGQVPRRSLLMDLAFGVLVTFLFFLVLESGLRLFSVAGPVVTEDPFVGFSRIVPLYTLENGQARTADARQKYFNKETFSAKKQANTFRVFCFGGSTTYGHPFDGRTAFPRWLEELLRESAPSTKFEVINAGGISYASYRIVPLIKETLTYQPDLMVVYTGHNEFLETRTYSKLINRPGSITFILEQLAKLRVYYVLKRLIEPLFTTARAKEQVNRPVLPEEVAAILDKSSGLDLYHRDKAFLDRVCAHFQENLERMADLCSSAGVPLIFVMPPSNLRDFSPFKSEHAPDLTLSQKKLIQGAILEAERLIKEGNYDEALDKLADAERLDSVYAELHYWKAKALLGLRRPKEAYESFVQAKDLDVAPLRIISPLEDKLRVVAEKKIPLLPFKTAIQDIAALRRNGSPAPGNESFLDHVHPTIERHQLLAELLLSKIAEMKMVRIEKQLGDNERKDIYNKVMSSFDKSFFINRDLNLIKTLRWAGKKAEARSVLTRLTDQIQDNPEIHKILGSYYIDDGNSEAGLKQYEQAVKLSGNDPEMVYSLATAYSKAGRTQSAMEAYQAVIAGEKVIPEAYANLATLLLEQGDVKEAEALLEKGLTVAPDAPALFAPYGLALAISGASKDALPWMINAAKAEPGNPGNFYNLAGLYALLGDKDEALMNLDLAVQKGYTSSDKIENDRVFDSLRNTDKYKAILRRIR